MLERSVRGMTVSQLEPRDFPGTRTIVHLPPYKDPMAQLIRFGRFVFDGDRRQLTADGAPVAIQPKVLDLLALLLRRHPSAVPKRQIYETLWPDVIVEEANVHNLISELRTILGDSDRTWIRTVHRYGYAFAGPLDVATRWELRVGEQRLPLQPGENVVGRDESVDVRIDAPGISRRHALIFVREEGATVQDLESKNGTFVDGIRIQAVTEAGDGAVIVFAQVSTRLRRTRAGEATITL